MRVILVDDSVLLRQGVARLLTDEGCDVCAQLDTADGLVEAVTLYGPDLVVLDIRMPPTHTTEGLQAAIELRAIAPEVAIVLLSQHVETRYAIELIGNQPQRIGYLLKDRVANIGEFIATLRSIHGGATVIDPSVVSRLLGRERRNNPLDRLTDRERELLGLMAEGRSNSGLAEQLSLNIKTVESHVRNIFTKLDLDVELDDHRRVRAVLLYLSYATS
jgi:DNA-binding NarL/FixJ family response regulator